MAGSQSTYRDRIYIVKDLILKLVEYGEMNQTALISFCGLNLKKHKYILDDLELNGLISKKEVKSNKRMITVYSPTEKGIDFSRTILEPYEKMFPRRRNRSEETRTSIYSGENENK
ncbi:MAG TPA: winged helix-turn-helix domain-containing protein [Nitrososphaeraceae archaeon]|jgi:predicted transcriptional regulator